MISPNSRKLLSDALTPPPAMHFDVGVVTTFSLDPITLLSVPLRLAWRILFEVARANRSADDSDLVPYWIYETENGAMTPCGISYS